MALGGFINGKAFGSLNSKCTKNCKSCSRYRCTLNSGIAVMSTKIVSNNRKECDRDSCYMCRYNVCNPKGSSLVVLGRKR